MDEHEFQELQQQLRERRDKIHQRLRKIQHEIRGGDESFDRDLEDQAIELENHDVLNRLEPQTRRELSNILAALERIEEGTYGQCVECGNAISTDRLKAMPETVKCIECAEEAEMS